MLSMAIQAAVPRCSPAEVKFDLGRKGEIAGIPCGTAKNKPKKNFALTREKQKKTPKSTKTPPKNNKNTKKQQKNTQKKFSR